MCDPDQFARELALAAAQEPLDQALAGLFEIAGLLGIRAATFEAPDVAGVCDLIITEIRRLKETG